MFGLGTQELLIILVLVMIIFGAGKLPQVGGSLGKGLRNFKKGMNDTDEEIEEASVEEIEKRIKKRTPESLFSFFINMQGCIPLGRHPFFTSFDQHTTISVH